MIQWIQPTEFDDMTRQMKKDNEVRLVKQMLSAFGPSPAGQIEPADGPDTLLVSDGCRIGIEVTELHQERSQGQALRRSQESERAIVASHACELAEDLGMPPLDVAVYFNESVSITKRDRNTIASELVRFVSTRLPGCEDSATVELWRQGGEPLPWIHAVQLFRTGLLTKHHWAVPDSGFVQTDLIPELQRAIDRKGALLSRYRQHCDECWLLAWASGGRPSGLFEPSDETKSYVYRSLFDRTFFMEAFRGDVVELDTNIR